LGEIKTFLESGRGEKGTINVGNFFLILLGWVGLRRVHKQVLVVLLGDNQTFLESERQEEGPINSRKLIF
jgi:hypothetical protein